MRRFLLLAIRAYQRFVSPYKGFSCAYRVHTGHASCSTLGYRAVRRYGVVAGLAVLRERTYRCGVAQRRHAARSFTPPTGQRGVCDIGCDLPCDANCHCPGGFNGCDCCNCGGGCEWPGRKPDDEGAERRVYIPPQRLKSVAADRVAERVGIG